MMLSESEAKLLRYQTGALTTATEIIMRRVGVMRLLAFLESAARLRLSRSVRTSDPAIAQQIADIVDESIRKSSLYPAQCLSRSLVLHYLLLRKGQNSVFKMGVQTVTGHFRAHAWVECDGKQLNEPLPPHELYQNFRLAKPALGTDSGT